MVFSALFDVQMLLTICFLFAFSSSPGARRELAGNKSVFTTHSEEQVGVTAKSAFNHNEAQFIRSSFRFCRLLSTSADANLSFPSHCHLLHSVVDVKCVCAWLVERLNQL